MAYQPLQFGVYYHIYNRGNNRESLFPQERNYAYFLKLYAKYILPVAVTYAYVLISNHFHLLIRTRTREEQEAYWCEQHHIGSISKTEPMSTSNAEMNQIGSVPKKTGSISEREQTSSVSKLEPVSFKPIEPSRAFNNLFIAYTKAINKAIGRTGALFETPFHRKPVTHNRYFQQLIAYIHQNPQKHGFVEDYRNWKWSSYGAILSDKTSQLQREETLAFFSSREKFIEAHRFLSQLDDEDWFNLGD